MEWGDYENSAEMIALYEVGQLASKIFTTPMKLKISKIFVYWAIKRLMKIGTVVDHLRQGHTCSIRTKRLVQTVAAQIW